MNEKPIIPSRTAKGWVVVNEGGYPMLDSVARLHSEAIRNFETSGWGESFDYCRCTYGMKVVRCTVTTEP
jgi:hypothetical protein